MYFIALASHLHYVRPFWKLYPHNGGDLSALGLIFNPRWLKHPSAWLNVDRAIQLVGEEVEERGTHPARSDGSKAAGISSRSDEYLNGGLMCNALGTHRNFPYHTNTRPSLQVMDVWPRDGASRWHPATSEEMCRTLSPDDGWRAWHRQMVIPVDCEAATAGPAPAVLLSMLGIFQKSCPSSSVFLQKRLLGICAAT